MLAAAPEGQDRPRCTQVQEGEGGKDGGDTEPRGDPLGREAAARAINEAKIKVAEQEREQTEPQSVDGLGGLELLCHFAVVVLAQQRVRAEVVRPSRTSARAGQLRQALVAPHELHRECGRRRETRRHGAQLSACVGVLLLPSKAGGTRAQQ